MDWFLWVLWISITILMMPVIVVFIGIICIVISDLIEWCNSVRKDW